MEIFVEIVMSENVLIRNLNSSAGHLKAKNPFCCAQAIVVQARQTKQLVLNYQWVYLTFEKTFISVFVTRSTSR